MPASESDNYYEMAHYWLSENGLISGEFDNSEDEKLTASLRRLLMEVKVDASE